MDSAARHRIITLTTDFGMRDGFVGTMKGVILGINPEAEIVDITHEIAPQGVEQAAFIAAASARYFPPSAIHVVVVDPGVGSARRAIAMQKGETILVGPDNGVLSLLASGLKQGGEEVQAVHLTRPQFWLPRVSNTFHGRDVFAPCAAQLSLGAPLEALGEPIADWVRLAPVLATQREDGAWVGRVRHSDRFGNLVTNITEEMLRGAAPPQIVVQLAGKTIVGLKPTYAEGAEGELMAVIGSNWDLEIVQRNGNAAEALGAAPGAEVVVWVAQD